MSSMAVIGDRFSTLGFKALGFLVYATDDPRDAALILHRLAREDTAIIFLTEQLAASMDQDLQRYQASPSTAVILIPGSAGSLGIGRKQIQALTEKAVGADILHEQSEVQS